MRTEHLYPSSVKNHGAYPKFTAKTRFLPSNPRGPHCMHLPNAREYHNNNNKNLRDHTNQLSRKHCNQKMFLPHPHQLSPTQVSHLQQNHHGTIKLTIGTPSDHRIHNSTTSHSPITRLSINRLKTQNQPECIPHTLHDTCGYIIYFTSIAGVWKPRCEKMRAKCGRW